MGSEKTVREVLNEILHDDNFIYVGLKGSIGYENISGYDFFRDMLVGQRMKNVVYYYSNLGAGSSYTSSSFELQNGADANHTEIRVFLYQEGSTNVEVKVQQSIDGSNWYDTDSISLSGNGVAVLKADVYLRYGRVVEINHDSSNGQTKNLLYVVVR